ncbi:MAG: hypothetical protein OEY89_09450 [Gammaproteobacteria bacterium]|nr:hypothetical protein [Gammaproteobacteria bacterium]
MPRLHSSLRFAIALCIVSQAAPVFAERTAPTAYSSPLKVQLEQQRVVQAMNISSEFLRPHFASDDIQTDSYPRNSNPLKQYDAAVIYPMAHDGFDIGLGVNLRMIEGMSFSSENGQTQGHNFSEAIPMFYASALLNLPFEGLSAGLEGRHSDSLSNRSFDYKARLRYEWSNGLGFEGSWQHQQYTDDRLNAIPDSNESNSLFLDMRLKF